jgi:hypothetical protein
VAAAAAAGGSSGDAAAEACSGVARDAGRNGAVFCHVCLLLQLMPRAAVHCSTTRQQCSMASVFRFPALWRPPCLSRWMVQGDGSSTAAAGVMLLQGIVWVGDCCCSSS